MLWVPLKYEINTCSADSLVVDRDSKHWHLLQQQLLLSVRDGLGQSFKGWVRPILGQNNRFGPKWAMAKPQKGPK